MADIENGRAAEIRRSLERKYAGALAHMLIASLIKPEEGSEAYSEWADSKEFISRLETEDSRTFNIVTRLSQPIDERIVAIKRKLMEERLKLTTGYRKRAVRLFAEEIECLDLDYRWRVVKQDMKPRPGAGGCTVDGTYIPPYEVYVEPPVEPIKGPDEGKIMEFEKERQKYLAPLSPGEKHRRDHELG